MGEGKTCSICSQPIEPWSGIVNYQFLGGGVIQQTHSRCFEAKMRARSFWQRLRYLIDPHSIN